MAHAPSTLLVGDVSVKAQTHEGIGGQTRGFEMLHGWRDSGEDVEGKTELKLGTKMISTPDGLGVSTRDSPIVLSLSGEVVLL